MLKRTLGLALGLAMMAQAGLAAAAEEAPEDPVVAVVNGADILQSEVLEAASRLPAEYQSQLAVIFPALIERLIDMKVIALAAAGDGLADDEEVLARIERRKEEIMRDVYLERLVADAVTDESLEAAYQEYLEENPPKVEVKARHILLESEEDAAGVIAELDGGADFAVLAKERSTGPSSASGGDLGYFTKDQMVEPFAEAAFALEPDRYTSAPVQTQFGWHVILVEDRRTSEALPREEVEVELTNSINREAVRKRVEALRAEAEIEVVTGDGEPATPAEGESGQQ